MSLYPHPFSAAYWRDAARELRDLRKLTFAALMIALCVVLGHIPSVPLFGGAKITWGFLARALCALVCGPVLGVVFGFSEDILSFFLTGGGGYPFFPGYTLTTMLGVLIYALFLYRAELNIRRVFLAKLLTNIQNVVLGSLWSAILYGKAWSVMAVGSFWKNLIMLPFQTALLVVLFAALLAGPDWSPGRWWESSAGERENNGKRRADARRFCWRKTGNWRENRSFLQKFKNRFPFVHKLFISIH